MRINKDAIELEMARQGLVVYQLADKAGVSYKGLRMLLERGECMPRTAGRIANALGVDVGEIVEKEE